MNVELKKIKKNNKRNAIFLVLTLVMFLGISLAAYLVYNFQDSRANELTTGLISIDFTENSGIINLENTVPVLDEVGLQNTPYEFTVKNTSKVPINLKIQLEVQDETTIPLGAIRYAFYINNELKTIDNIKLDENGSLYIHNNFPSNETVSCKLIFWVDYYYENPGETFSAKIKATGESFDIFAPEFGSDKLKKAIAANTNDTCNPIVEEDGIIYFSGTNDCVDFNYVWYSGKLWRVTAIYPDGSMKMITDDIITIISYGSNNIFYTTETAKSYIYQWLNEDFLSTLYNYENIVSTKKAWNVTASDYSLSYKLPETTMVNAKVGLLNSYEYYKSYETLGEYENGYLNIDKSWYLSNPWAAASSGIWSIDNSGKGVGIVPNGSGTGVRPSINLENTIEFLSGEGTEIEPYRIRGDKDDIEINTTLLNTRSSGEYVEFDEELYRIVNIEKNTTKLKKDDYIRNNISDGLKKYLSSNLPYGSPLNTQNDNYWDYYLNNTWYNNISSDYKSMLEKGTYYLGVVSSSEKNYKTAICTNASSTISTFECIKTDEIWQGYVGILRYGEMFALFQQEYHSSLNSMWLITPSDSELSVWDASSYAAGYSNPTSTTNYVHPTINLKSTIVIKSGSGTKQDPFVVGLPN